MSAAKRRYRPGLSLGPAKLLIGASTWTESLILMIYLSRRGSPVGGITFAATWAMRLLPTPSNSRVAKIVIVALFMYAPRAFPATAKPTRISWVQKIQSCMSFLFSKQEAQKPLYRQAVSSKEVSVWVGEFTFQFWEDIPFDDFAKVKGRTHEIAIPMGSWGASEVIKTNQRFYPITDFEPQEIRIWDEIDRLSENGDHEEAAWVLRTKDGKILTRMIPRLKTDDFDEISLSHSLKVLNSLLIDHALSFAHLESISFFHNHPANGSLPLSPADIYVVDIMAPEAAAENPDLMIHMFAMLSRRSTRLVSHYGRRVGDQNSIVFEPFDRFQKQRESENQTRLESKR